MKRLIAIITILLVASVASCQSSLCLQFMPQKNIQTYCVDNYPLGNDDSINVTFLLAADSDAYHTLLLFLGKLPNQKGKTTIERHYFGGQSMIKDSAFVIRLSSSLPGDKGRYLTFFSPHNMSAMVFHIRSDNDMEKVVAHVLTKETITD